MIEFTWLFIAVYVGMKYQERKHKKEQERIKLLLDL